MPPPQRPNHILRRKLALARSLPRGFAPCSPACVGVHGFCGRFAPVRACVLVGWFCRLLLFFFFSLSSSLFSSLFGSPSDGPATTSTSVGPGRDGSLLVWRIVGQHVQRNAPGLAGWLGSLRGTPTWVEPVASSNLVHRGLGVHGSTAGHQAERTRRHTSPTSGEDHVTAHPQGDTGGCVHAELIAGRRQGWEAQRATGRTRQSPTTTTATTPRNHHRPARPKGDPPRTRPRTAKHTGNRVK